MAGLRPKGSHGLNKESSNPSLDVVKKQPLVANVGAIKDMGKLKVFYRSIF